MGEINGIILEGLSFRVTYAPAMNTGTVPGVRVALELRILKS